MWRRLLGLCTFDQASAQLWAACQTAVQGLGLQGDGAQALAAVLSLIAEIPINAWVAHADVLAAQQRRATPQEIKQQKLAYPKAAASLMARTDLAHLLGQMPDGAQQALAGANFRTLVLGIINDCISPQTVTGRDRIFPDGFQTRGWRPCASPSASGWTTWALRCRGTG